MSFEKLRRVNYAPPPATTNCLSGQAVEADFQQYHLPAARAHNLALHGTGVATGLSLSVSGGRVVVSPGAAVDGQGRLIVLAANSRFFSGEAMRRGPGSAGVDLPPAPTTAGSLHCIVSIEHAEDPRADDPASPKCGMIEQVPWIRLRSDGTNVGDAVVLGAVELDPAGHVFVRVAERVVPDQAVGEIRFRVPRVDSGLLAEFDAASIHAQDSALHLSVSGFPGEVRVSRDNGQRFATFVVIADTAEFDADMTVGGKINGRKVEADGMAIDVHVARTDNPHGVTAAQAGALSTTGGALSGNLQVSGSLDVNGRVNCRDVAADGSRLDTHVAQRNPHGTLASDVGALPTSGGRITGSVTMDGALVTMSANMTRLPTGWGGGVHTWDVYAEGSIGCGRNGNANVLLTRDGIIKGITKQFHIAHPLDPTGSDLIHACIEGPEIAVYYRGEARLHDGEATIELPAYFEALTRIEGRTVLLTPILEGDCPVGFLAASRVEQGRFRVRGAGPGDPGQAFFWEVKAIRADVDPLIVELSRNGRSLDPR